MQIVKVEQFGSADELKLIEEPDPVAGEGQILVDVKASGVNYADVMSRAGHYPGVASAPFYPGLEVAGIVTGVGKGVPNFAVGDRVLSALTSRGYSSKAVLDSASVVKIPDGLEFAEATALLVQGLTAYFLLQHGGIGIGKRVLIPSAGGGLGSLAIQIAKLKGASTVIGLASAGKHDLVKELGADIALDYTKPGWAKDVRTHTDNKGVDIYLDSGGDLAGEGFDALGYGAHWLIFGSQAGGTEGLAKNRLGPIVGNNITLRGYNLYFDLANFGQGLGELIPWAVSGALKINVEAFPLSKAAEAHQAIENRKTSGKVVLVP